MTACLSGCDFGSLGQYPFPSSVPLMGLGQVPSPAQPFVAEAERMAEAGVPLDAVVAKLAEAFAALSPAEHPELIKALRLDYADEMIESARRQAATATKKKTWPAVAAGAAVGLLAIGLLIRGALR